MNRHGRFLCGLAVKTVGYLAHGPALTVHGLLVKFLSQTAEFALLANRVFLGADDAYLLGKRLFRPATWIT